MTTVERLLVRRPPVDNPTATAARLLRGGYTLAKAYSWEGLGRDEGGDEGEAMALEHVEHYKRNGALPIGSNAHLENLARHLAMTAQEEHMNGTRTRRPAFNRPDEPGNQLYPIPDNWQFKMSRGYAPSHFGGFVSKYKQTIRAKLGKKVADQLRPSTDENRWDSMIHSQGYDAQQRTFERKEKAAGRGKQQQQVEAGQERMKLSRDQPIAIHSIINDEVHSPSTEGMTDHELNYYRRQGYRPSPPKPCTICGKQATEGKGISATYGALTILREYPNHHNTRGYGTTRVGTTHPICYHCAKEVMGELKGKIGEGGLGAATPATHTAIVDHLRSKGLWKDEWDTPPEPHPADIEFAQRLREQDEPPAPKGRKAQQAMAAGQQAMKLSRDRQRGRQA